jgi:hypothetical protein
MAKWGNVDYKQLQRFQKQMEQMQKKELDKFCEEAAKELAARLLGKVIRRTPVGEYNQAVNFTTKDGKEVSFNQKSSKIGGVLRRGWTTKTEREAELSAAFGRGSNTREYINSLKIVREGNDFVIEIINPVHYASYVEFGHRSANHEKWIEGKFMLTISEREVDSIAPVVLEQKLLLHLKECMNVK